MRDFNCQGHRWSGRGSSGREQDRNKPQQHDDRNKPQQDDNDDGRERQLRKSLDILNEIGVGNVLRITVMLLVIWFYSVKFTIICPFQELSKVAVDIIYIRCLLAWLSLSAQSLACSSIELLALVWISLLQKGFIFRKPALSIISASPLKTWEICYLLEICSPNSLFLTFNAT